MLTVKVRKRNYSSGLDFTDAIDDSEEVSVERFTWLAAFKKRAVTHYTKPSLDF